MKQIFRAACGGDFKGGVGRNLGRWLVVLVCGFLALLTHAAEPGPPGVSPKALRVVMDDNYPPYVFLGPDGQLQGILVDQWRAWERKTGVAVELHAMDWGEAVQRMRAGEFDVIDTIFATKARREYFDFTPAYATIEVPIFFRNDISGITDITSLRGFPVGAKTGDYAVDLLRAGGVATIVEFHNYEAVVEAAQQRRIGVFVVDEPPAHYFLHKFGIADEFRHSESINVGQFHRAVRKGNADLLRRVNEGFGAIGPEELSRIEEKWMGRSVRGGRYFAYAGYLGAAALLVVGGLLGWNWGLRRIIERRTAALRESEARFRAMFEQAAVGVAQLETATGRFMRVNQRYADIVGYARGELEGLDFQTVTHPDDRQADCDNMKRLVAGEIREFSLEKRYVRKGGGDVWVLLTVSPMWAPGAKPDFHIAVVEDITARKNAEAERRLIFERVTDAFVALDRDGSLTYVNPKAAQILGRPAGDLIGRTIWSEAPDTFGAPVRQACEQAMSDQRPAVVEESQTGTGRWFSHRVYPSAGGLTVYFHDITDRKRDEQRIRQLNRTYALLSDINQLMVRERQPQTILEAACRTAVEIGGFRMAWVGLLEGEEPSRIRVAAHAGASPRTLERLDAIVGPSVQDCGCVFTGRAFATGEHAICNDIEHDPEAEYWREAALRREYLSMVSLPLKSGKATIGTFNLYAAEPDFFDADEMRLLDELAVDLSFSLEVSQREVRFQRMIEHSSDLITLVDKSGEIRFQSSSVERLLGYTPAELVGRNALDLVHPEDRDKVAAALAGAAGGSADPTPTEYRLQHRDGTWRHVASGGATIDEAAGVRLIVINSRDMTRSRQLEEQLRQSQKMEAIGQLSGGIAHDFNNLLTVISGNISLLKAESGLAGAAAGYVEEIGQAAQRAAHLTRQLLTFSRQQRIQLVPLDLNEVVGNLARILSRILGEDIAIRYRYAPGALPVLADAVMLEQVLLNLAVNARDAMPHGGFLSIETAAVTARPPSASDRPDPAEGRYARLSVQDGGVGIAPGNLRRIFDPFFTTKDVGKGTGLGLATVYGIVQQHGGWIDVASEPGQGTTFHIHLPASTRALPARAETEETISPGQGSETILLVEDEAAVRMVVAIVLRQAGYRVLDAASGADALEIWREHRGQIQLLLTDYVMPDGMSGKQLVERILPEDPGLRVIFTSGYSQEIAGADFALEEGVNFLSKPFALPHLVKTVRRCLDAPQSRSPFAGRG